jgi:hypothetical protein
MQWCAGTVVDTAVCAVYALCAVTLPCVPCVLIHYQGCRHSTMFVLSVPNVCAGCVCQCRGRLCAVFVCAVCLPYVCVPYVYRACMFVRHGVVCVSVRECACTNV